LRVRNVTESLACRLLIIALILMDIIVFIIDLADPDVNQKSISFFFSNQIMNIKNKNKIKIKALQIITFVIVSIFWVEISLRIFSFGGMFFQSVLNIFDLLVLVISFIVIFLYEEVHICF